MSTRECCARHLHSRDHVKSSCCGARECTFSVFSINELKVRERDEGEGKLIIVLKGGINFHSFMDVAIDKIFFCVCKKRMLIAVLCMFKLLWQKFQFKITKSRSRELLKIISSWNDVVNFF